MDNNLQTIKKREGVFARAEAIIEKKKEARERMMAKKWEKEGEGAKAIYEEKRIAWRSREGKMPRLTSFTAVAMSKSSPGESKSDL